MCVLALSGVLSAADAGSIVSELHMLLLDPPSRAPSPNPEDADITAADGAQADAANLSAHADGVVVEQSGKAGKRKGGGRKKEKQEGKRQRREGGSAGEDGRGDEGKERRKKKRKRVEEEEGGRSLKRKSDPDRVKRKHARGQRGSWVKGDRRLQAMPSVVGWFHLPAGWTDAGGGTGTKKGKRGAKEEGGGKGEGPKAAVLCEHGKQVKK